MQFPAKKEEKYKEVRRRRTGESITTRNKPSGKKNTRKEETGVAL
jgi:hypothetical protein